MKTVPLATLADIQLGKMLSPRAKTGKESYPYLRNQNVQWLRLDLRDLALMDFSERERGKFELVNGDLLVCEGGEPGRCALWMGEVTNCFYQKAIHRVRPKEGKLNSEFLSYWLWLQCKYRTSPSEGSRTTIAHLPLNQLQQFPVPELPIAEQRTIAAALNERLAAVRQAQAAAQKQVAELSALMMTLITNSVATANVTTASLGRVLNEVKAGVGSAWKTFPVLGATRDGLAPARERPGKHPERYKPVTAGTVFYNPMRILIGSIAFVDDDDEPGITSPDYVVLKGKPGVVDSRWFYYWLRSPLGERCIQSLARGAVRERMLFNRLAEGEIELPDHDVQVKASKALAQIKPMRAAIQKQIEELELLPRKLLAEVFEA